MKEIVPYLIFPGNCREAMTFYAEALGAQVDIINFGQMPNDPTPPSDKVMHARLGTTGALLMASDAMPGMPFAQGVNSFSVAITSDNPEEQARHFNALAAGGQITMPLGDTFWGARFGMLTDRFGINWMFNYDKPRGEQPAA